MQCSQIRKMLANYALDDARITERLCVDVHTSHCAACRKELEDTCELVAATERALSYPGSTLDFETLMARIEASEMIARDLPTRAQWTWRGVAMRSAAAAAVMAAVIITIPVARNAGHVVREFRDVSVERTTESDEPEQVPVVSEPFVKRADWIKSAFDQAPAAATNALVQPPQP
ncbi:MAG: hypothetical protein IT366_00255 [Candidatus Hydrogenedentes bacterium]|nr:hypothetical protein [Candidatus Hydrogenedentota bacterium]